MYNQDNVLKGKSTSCIKMSPVAAILLYIILLDVYYSGFNEKAEFTVVAG